MRPIIALIVSLSCLQLVLGNEPSQQKCHLLKNKVCLCTAAYCDYLDFEWPQEPGSAVLISSSQAGARFDVQHLSRATNESLRGDRVASVDVDTRARHQQIMGWGGAFTDATGQNLRQLTRQVADQLLLNYFGPRGLLYNMGRVPIGGSDFSAREYTYDEMPAGQVDFELKEWSLAPEDHDFKIPYIQQALDIAKARGVNVKLFASPWSAPRWMKTNHKLTRGKLIDDDRVYRSYAEYLMKFYDAYRQQGIKFWGATVQNEPMSSLSYPYFFTSMNMEAGQMRKFISRYLGPALEARNYTRDNFKLIVGDDNLGLVNSLVPDLLEDSEVAKYVSGFAYHWYEAGYHLPHALLSALQRRIRDKVEFSIMSEACTGWQAHERGTRIGSWIRAEAYAFDIIEGLSRNATAWIDWNMALDLQGGPNWAGNFVDSPILVNGERDEYYKQPMYYALGHFTKFMRPGSVVVDSWLSDNVFDEGKLMAVAALNTETGHLIVNLLNRYNSTLQVNLRDSSCLEEEATSERLRSIPLALEANSINTVVIKL